MKAKCVYFCVNTMILKDICVDEVPSYHIARNFGSNYIWQKCVLQAVLLNQARQPQAGVRLVS